MAEQSLETRVAALEKEVAELRSQNGLRLRDKDWQRTIGMFNDDPIMREILDLALKYRAADRKHARQRRSTTRRTKS